MDHLARAQRMLELQEAENARVSTGFSLIRAWSSSELLWPHPSCWLWQHKQTQRLAEDCRIYFICVFFDAQWMHIRIQCKHCNPDVPSSLHLISLGHLKTYRFHPKIKNTFFPLNCSTIHPSRLFRCELQSFWDNSCRDVCLLSNMME